ncbi:hypothetical protein GCM10007301_27930 [Azorhizobium oxalatiphilum]|uniref:Uncharacterized protein n=1 Tax=Azorhizobium oxalatiphilum TaxID=980631 RepID=A0A917FC11_9HYPH|nr:hypothetical protein [Azorhizobium oxalatiphilum]GGF66648.1 hypothetical protein GCM10007301_27930 [Azorhizobium oxalatiphilum]
MMTYGSRKSSRSTALLRAAGLCLAAFPASASSPDAWAELFGKAKAACLKASGLKEARALGAPTDFSDRVLVLVSGRWPQPHMKNQKATFACLYGKASGQAEAQELTTPP